jgi:hypothetical protein
MNRIRTHDAHRQRNRHQRLELPPAHFEGQKGFERDEQRRDFEAFARQTGNDLVLQEKTDTSFVFGLKRR